MKDFLQSSKIKATLWIVGGAIILLLVFGLGIAVGYRKAVFASRWGESYYHNFYGGVPSGPMGGPESMMRPPVNMHGVAGEVLDVSTSTISVQDPVGNEQSVVVSTSTSIRTPDGANSLADITVGEWITVIGSPNAEGQIDARFIRVFEASSSLPNNTN